MDVLLTDEQILELENPVGIRKICCLFRERWEAMVVLDPSDPDLPNFGILVNDPPPESTIARRSS